MSDVPIGPELGPGLGTAEERAADEALRQNAAAAEAHRRARRMKGKRSTLDLIKYAQARPIVLTVVAVFVVLTASWGGYLYHVSYHKYFGKFTPHEQYLCREEELMLGLQKLMLRKAKAELLFLHGDPGSGGLAKARREKQYLIDKSRFDDNSGHGPAHPTLDVHDTKQRSKIKGLQMTHVERRVEDLSPDERKEWEETIEYAPNRVYVSSDMGFYQMSYGNVNIDTESGSTMVGQALGTHSRVGNGFSTMVYYRIWKNANDYIRGMLYQYSQKKARLDGVKPVCRDLKDCRHLPEMHLKVGRGLHNIFFPANLRRYPFTFVRHPLNRFISGYTEIEYRYKQAQVEHEWWLEHHSKKAKVKENFVYDKEHSTEKAIEGAKLIKAKQEKDRKAKIAAQSKFATLSKKHIKGNAAQARSVRSHHNKAKAEYDQHGTIEGPGIHLEKKVLPMKASIGTAARFMEFIDMVLMFDGSRRIFKTFDTSSEMAHIAPQVGTIFAANLAESLPLRQYKLEAFRDEWRSLSEETAQPRLLQVREALKNHTNLWSHPSSGDEYNTTRASSEFIENATVITMEQLKQAEEKERAARVARAVRELERVQVQFKLGLAENTEVIAATTAVDRLRAEENSATQSSRPYKITDTVADTGTPFWLTLPEFRTQEVYYTRALCRIYLSDFICTDYSLPDVCADIIEDVDIYTAEYELKQREKAWANRSLANTLLPDWLLYAIAEIPCTLFADSPPSCISSFVHGDVLDEKDDFDEWPDDHDEL